METLKDVEHSLEEKLHNILHELEAKLQSLFGSHPKIAEHVAEAKAQVSEVVGAPIESHSTTEEDEGNKDPSTGAGNDPAAAS